MMFKLFLAVAALLSAAGFVIAAPVAEPQAAVPGTSNAVSLSLAAQAPQLRSLGLLQTSLLLGLRSAIPDGGEHEARGVVRAE